MKRFFLLLTLILVPCLCYSQHYRKEIKSKEATYLHGKTGFALPDKIDGYKRFALYAFDRKKEGVGADYQSGSTKVSVYVYPASEGYEDRLRKEFLRALAEVPDYEEVEEQRFEVDCVSHHSGKYLIHGLMAKSVSGGKQSLISLYECGRWWMNFRITDSHEDARLDLIEEQFRNSLNPEILISSKPLGDQFDVYFHKTAFRDSLMLGCVMGDAYAKINWMVENLDPLEFQAGVPSIYLDYHIAGIDGSIKFAQEHPDMTSSPVSKEILAFLMAAKKEGYLEELIFDEKGGCISVPDSVSLDMDGYQEWLTDHPMIDGLFSGHSVISNQ